jgi:DNA-binding MarR family transcriptional regulator
MVSLPKEITTTILLTVFERGEVTMTQLQKETGFSTITVLNHVEALLAANLLEERREKALPKRRFLNLSKEGVRVATTLNMIINSMIDPRMLIDLGAKAGRMGAYREAVNMLRPSNITRDYAIAELLLKDLETLIESIATVIKALPSEFAGKKEALNGIVEKINVQAIDARKYLEKRDVRRSAETVALAWREYGKESRDLEELLGSLRGMKLDELVKIIEFIAPVPAQKE